MTRHWTRILSLTASLALVAAAVAQPPDGTPRGDEPPRGDAPRRGDGPPEGRPGFRGGPGRELPPLPVLVALDANKDGEISAEEISNAVAALKSLDKNEDGKLTRQELMPDPEEMRRRGFGRPGDGPGARRDRGPREGRVGDRRPESRDAGDRSPEGRRRAARRGEGGPPEAGVMVERMMRQDKDGDGKLSKEELPERMQNMLSRLDTNDDGVVDRAEIEQMVRQRLQGQRGREGAERRQERSDEERETPPRRESPEEGEPDDN